MRRGLRVLAAVAALAGVSAQACDGLVVDDAWIREPPPGAGSVALYMRLLNAGTSALVVTSVSSPLFAHGMLHETIADGERVRMRHVEQLTLAPGQQAVLAPGSLHAMLMQPTAALPQAGDRVGITLECADGQFSLDVPVRRP